jgi:hypothetical protein
MKLWSFLLPTNADFRSARVAAPNKDAARLVLAAELGGDCDDDAICQFAGAVDLPEPAVIELLERGAPT